MIINKEMMELASESSILSSKINNSSFMGIHELLNIVRRFRIVTRKLNEMCKKNKELIEYYIQLNKSLDNEDYEIAEKYRKLIVSYE